MNKYIRTFFCWVFVIFVAQNSTAQDLEPRSLSSIPTGGNFAIVSYAYSTGNILVDNSLPVEDLNAKINSMVFAYAKSFKLFNKLTKFNVVVPYSFGNFSAVVSSNDTSTSRTGFADPSIRLSMVFIGEKPLGVKEFFSRTPKKFNLGASIKIRAPLGQYNNTKLINLGANRWGLKLGMGSSYKLSNKLILEGQINTWFFTKNNAFFNGNELRQKPILSAQIHLAYIFKPGVWLAASYGGSGWGESIVNDVEKENGQNNSRFGIAFAQKINNKSALKIAFTSGISTRYGANFSTLFLAYQFIWFDKK